MRARKATILAVAALSAALLLPAAPAKALNLAGLFGSPVDAELAAQVPQNKRGPINKAEFELACANQDVELAKLKEELADRQDDLANQNTKLAKAVARGAEISLDLARMEGIMSNNLGKAEDNKKVLQGLQADRAKNAADVGELKTKIGAATLMVRDWTQRVAQKEKSVAEFKARRTPDAVVPAPAAPAKVPAKTEEPLEIVNPEPGAKGGAPAPAPAAPEADLKN